MTDRAPAKRALLVGIRNYPFISEQYGQPLAGCHNDVAGMREVLLEQGFPEADIRVLVDVMDSGCQCPFCPGIEAGRPRREAPTREGIGSAVAELTAATGPDDVAVFYYSGHGSEIAGRGLYAGQRFQTIVPHDSGRGDHPNRDITDREIEGWIRAFNRRTPYLTLIFDCCHSGGMADLRGPAATGSASGRRVAADERQEDRAFASELFEMPRPEQTEEDGRESAGASAPSSGASAPSTGDDALRGPTGWLRGAGRSAIVLSASAAKELSSETVAEGRKQGLFTARLHRALCGRDTAGLTWADVFPEIAEGVSRENLSQNPRREGDAPIFERGEIDTDDVYPPDVVELKKLAVVIGIDYDRSAAAGEGAAGEGAAGAGAPPGFPPLRTPKRDAMEVARVLSEVQGYEIVGLSRRSPGPLLNEKATRRRIHTVINRLIAVKARAQREVAALIYFAGHGVVRTGDDGEHAGYLVPWDAGAEDPDTWLPMKDLRDQLVDGIQDPQRLERLGHGKPLARLTSRHLLLVLDCCFGGALSFDFFRGGGSPDRPIYYSEYKRFVEGTAWQMLTSASFNQQAMDRNPKDPEQPHSPFAQAVIDGLTTAEADSLRSGSRSDQVITAAELHQYVDTRLQALGVDIQTPGLMSLRPLRGQFIFHVPGFKPSPLPDPPLHPGASPWCRDEAYGEAPDGAGEAFDPDLFCGRELAMLELLDGFLAPRYPDSEPAARPAVAVVGASGSGKTSLVQAGLLPLLEDPAGGRQRLRSYARRAGLRHFLITREDLKAVRQWAANFSLDAVPPEGGKRNDGPEGGKRNDGPEGGERNTVAGFCSLSAEQRAAKAQALADRIREWAQSSEPGGDAGLEDSEPGAGQIQTQVRMSHLGMPSFSASSGDVEDRGMLKRLGVFGSRRRRANGSLLDRPLELVERLRLWLAAGGLADFFSVSDRALTGLLGKWQVVTELADAKMPGDSDDPGVLLVIDALEERIGEIRRDAWKTFAASERTHTVATVRSDALRTSPRGDLRRELGASDAAGGPRWRQVAVRRPGRVELREVVQAPAAARAIVFEPPELVERLVEEVAATPAPLSLLSPTLNEMFQHAWRRRKDRDRLLVAADLGPMARPGPAPAEGVAGLFSRRAEATYQRLVAEDADAESTVRDLFLRAVSAAAEDSFAGERPASRPVPWRQLELADPAERRRLETRVLPELLEQRLMVAGQSHLELATAGLIDGWERLHGWVRQAAEGVTDLHALWRRALEWEASGCDPGKLWSHDQIVGRLFRSINLCRLERAFVVASEMARRVTAAGILAALPDLAGEWQRRALLAAEAAELAIDTRQVVRRLCAEPWLAERSPEDSRRPAAAAAGLATEARDLSRWAAEQALHDVLATTPFSVPLAVPAEDGRVAGLCFHGGDQLRLRVVAADSDDGDRGCADRIYAWNLHQLADPPILLADSQSPAPGAARVKARRLPFGRVKEFPAVAPPPPGPPGPKARAGHDKAIRYFAPLLLKMPARLGPFSIAPEVLLGHRGVPTFLAFSSFLGSGATKYWLASAADLPRGIEVRLWPIRNRARLPAQPRKLPGKKLAEVFPHSGAGTVDTPRIEAVAPDGSAFVLRHLDTRQAHTVELHRRRQDRETPPEFFFHPGGRWLAAISEAGNAWLWSLPDRTLRWSVPGGVTCLAFNPVAGGELLLAAGAGAGPPWWISPEISVTRPEQGPQGRASAVAFSPGGRRLAVGNLDGTVCLWTPSAGVRTPPVVLRGASHEGFAVSSVAFDREGRCLGVERRAVYDFNRRRVDVYRLDLGELVLLARGHAGRELEPGDLPPELRHVLSNAGKEPSAEPVAEPDRVQENRRYLAALAALV